MVAAWVGVLRTSCREEDSETRLQWDTAMKNSNSNNNLIIVIHLVAF